MNTREVVKKMKIIGGATALLTAAGLALGLKMTVNKLRKYKRNYNPETVEELSGRIKKIHRTNERNDEVRSVYMELQTGDELIEVHLGPAWYIEKQDIPKAGDKIHVSGSRISYHHKEIIVAAQIRRNGMKLVLRNEEGTPVWYAWSKN